MPKIIPNPELEGVYLSWVVPSDSIWGDSQQSGAKSEDRVLILGAGGLGILNIVSEAFKF